LKRGQYAVTVHDEIVNAGSAPWQGFVYRQLLRGQPNVRRGMTNPESFSLTGATWYGADRGYTRRGFNDFDEAVDTSDSSTWIAFVQHHFFSAWLPDGGTGAKNAITLSTDTSTGAPRYLI